MINKNNNNLITVLVALMIVLVALVIILLILLVWGLIGSSEAAKIGITCDVGMGEDGSVFCWKWHQNIIIDLEGTINQILNK